MPKPTMRALYLTDYMFDRVKDVIERELPNAAVTRYPDEFQADPELEAYFLCPRTMTPPPPR